MNAKVLLFGVQMNSNTMKHLIEYVMVNDLLDKIDDDEKRAELASRLRTHKNHADNNFVWPYSSGLKSQESIEAAGLIRHATCGSAVFSCYRAKDTNDYAQKLYETHPEDWYAENVIRWFADANAAARA